MSYGIRYIVENYVARRWTQQDVDQSALFFKCAALPSAGFRGHD